MLCMGILIVKMMKKMRHHLICNMQSVFSFFLISICTVSKVKMWKSCTLTMCTLIVRKNDDASLKTSNQNYSSVTEFTWIACFLPLTDHIVLWLLNRHYSTIILCVVSNSLKKSLKCKPITVWKGVNWVRTSNQFDVCVEVRAGQN